ncbi:MAG: hypothetical protein AAF590_11190 [Pseudomonadota bacterium]
MPVINPDGTLGRRIDRVYVLSQAETQDTNLVVIIRMELVFLSRVYNLRGLDWREFLLWCYQNLKVPILNRDGTRARMSLSWLDSVEERASNENLPPEGAEIQAVESRVSTFEENLRSYLNDTCRKVFDADGTAVVHQVNRHKFIDIATIVAASHPEISAYWPRHPLKGNKPPEAANDNVRDWLRHRG